MLTQEPPRNTRLPQSPLDVQALPSVGAPYSPHASSPPPTPIHCPSRRVAPNHWSQNSQPELSACSYHRTPRFSKRRKSPIPLRSRDRTPCFARIFSPIASCCRARSRHILPLRLTQQPILLHRLVRQPCDVSLCIIPIYATHRFSSRLPVSRVLPGAAVVVRPLLPIKDPTTTRGITIRLLHEHLILSTHHLVFPHREPLHYPHLVTLAFCIDPTFSV